MKTILCYGDSNVRGVIPGPLDEKTGLTARYAKNKRWTGVLQNKLGETYDIVEEGIGGRTTSLDEIIPGRPYRNGMMELPLCLESHYPIDLVIFLLGTNDTKLQFNSPVEKIADGMRQLVKIVKKCNKGPMGTAPKILLIAPAPIVQTPNLHPQFDETSIEKSMQLASFYQQIATEEGCEFFDASLVVTLSQIDGLHFDEPQCKLLGSVIADKVTEILLDRYGL